MLRKHHYLYSSKPYTVILRFWIWTLRQRYLRLQLRILSTHLVNIHAKNYRVALKNAFCFLSHNHLNWGRFYAPRGIRITYLIDNCTSVVALSSSSIQYTLTVTYVWGGQTYKTSGITFSQDVPTILKIAFSLTDYLTRASVKDWRMSPRGIAGAADQSSRNLGNTCPLARPLIVTTFIRLWQVWDIHCWKIVLLAKWTKVH